MWKKLQVGLFWGEATAPLSQCSYVPDRVTDQRQKHRQRAIELRNVISAATSTTLRKAAGRLHFRGSHISSYNFRTVLIYRKSVPVSHRHQTSCSEMNSEARISIEIHIQHWLRMDHTFGTGNSNYSDH